jgi:hypothetical protein
MYNTIDVCIKYYKKKKKKLEEKKYIVNNFKI